MNGKVTLDQAGRLVLPKPVREALRIGPGDSLNVAIEGERVVLTPVHVRPGLQKERGLWVFHSGKQSDVSIPDLIDDVREQRSRGLRGE
jgi:AbrB family looped-hinge helix DNA binding protein